MKSVKYKDKGIKAPKSSLITPILRSLHWLKINELIEYKLFSLTYKVLTTSQPDYLHNLISVQSTGRTRSSSVVSLARPSVFSSLQGSWFTSSCAYHLITITVITFVLTIYHSLDLSLKT